MGFHAEATGPGPSTLSGFYALLGCKAPGNSSDRGCGQPVTYNHINLEAWSEGYLNEWKLIQSQYASMAPVDVGSMGYDGSDDAGVETLPDGTLAAICPDDYFWLSPTCRQDSTRCVPYDLVTLAPSVEDLVRNLRLGRNDVMNMLKDMQDTGDSYDCGCPTGFIDASESTANLSCIGCGEGLDSPALATLQGLRSGSSSLGPEFVARVLPGFYSSMAEPLDLYRCVEAAAGTRCPGGIPATCTGLLNNRACTDCPSGRHWDRSEGHCEECTPWQQVGWTFAVAVMLAGLVMVYYMMTAQTTAKASVLFTTTCAFGMTIS
ncbi:unnamed protein product, partial [Symbiodinium microadriaticum]